MAEFRKVHQFNVFTVGHPGSSRSPTTWPDASRHLGLAAFYQAKRDFFRAALAASRFELLPSHGTYFQLARYGDLRTWRRRLLQSTLTRDVGVAAIRCRPSSPTVSDEHVIRSLPRQERGHARRRLRQAGGALAARAKPPQPPAHTAGAPMFEPAHPHAAARRGGTVRILDQTCPSAPDRRTAPSPRAAPSQHYGCAAHRRSAPPRPSVALALADGGADDAALAHARHPGHHGHRGGTCTGRSSACAALQYRPAR